MKRLLALTLVTLLAAALTVRADDAAKKAEESGKPADKDTFDAVVKDMLKALKTAAKLLSEVTDKATADKHTPELKKTVETMRGMKDRLAKIGKPTAEQEAEAEKKYKAEMEDAVKTIGAQVARLKNEPYAKGIVELLDVKKPALPADPLKDPGKP